MKRILLVAAVAGMAMVSCKKIRTCECSYTSTTYINGKATTTGPTTTSGDFDEKMTKKDAKSKCEEGNGTTSVGDKNTGVETTVSGCKLK